MVMTWGVLATGDVSVHGLAWQDGRAVSQGMLKFRSGVTLVVPCGPGAPVTWVFSLYVVQAGSACPR